MFEPLPEKLESIHKMPAPKSPKEVKQFLGLIGYYQKFVPRFSDISRPLTRLTCHDAKFEWSEKCEKSFNQLMRPFNGIPNSKVSGPIKAIYNVH